MARRRSGNKVVDVGTELPPLPDRLVERPALCDRLDELIRRPVTLVTAPAGYGKSTLVAHWCRTRCTSRYSWLRMADNDDGPLELLSAVVRAATATDRSLDAFEEWLAHDQDRLAQHGVDQVAALLSGSPESVVVVDGVDAADPTGVLADIAEAFTRANDCGAHLVVVGRWALPADMVPLQLQGQVARLDASDLELAPAETAGIVAAYSGRSLGSTLAVDLTARLEGWVASAALVGMSQSMNGGDPTVDDLMNAAFDDIGAYVDAEIIFQVDDDSREFLTATACLDVLPATLCDILLDRNDSEKLLSEMRISGLPVTRHASPLRSAIGAGWFRCLRPVREVLDHRRARDERAHRDQVLRTAAAWFSDHQQTAEAAECWVRVGDWNQVGDLIVGNLHQILRDHEIGWLVELVAQLPPSLIRERLNLALFGAWALRADGRVGPAYELLAVYEQDMTQLGRTLANVIRAGSVSWAEDVAGALGLADAAIAGFDELGADAYDHVGSSMPINTTATTATFRTIARGHALLASAYGALWERGDGHFVDVAPEAIVNLQQSWLVNLHGERATFLALSGRATDALAEARHALVRAEDSDLLDHRAAADAHYAIGEASRLTLRHEVALEAFDQAERLAEINQRRNLLASVTASRAHLLVDRGDVDEALSVLQRLAASHHRPPITLAGMLAAAEARALAHAGAHGRAMRVLEGAQPTAVTATTHVAVALALDDVVAARRAVANWPPESTVDSGVRRALADAAIAERSGEPVLAGQAMHAALSAAAEHGLLQPFVEYGPIIIRLLTRVDRVESGTAEQELARQVNAVIRGGSVAAVAPRFTAKEAIVLAYLTEGLQLRAVANEMHVSINTVKTHVTAIYRKLGVTNRTDAVAAWRGSLRPDPR